MELESCIEETNGKFIKIQKGDVLPSGIRPVISQENKPYIGFSNLELGYITKENLPLVIFGDHNLSIKFIEKEFFVGADGLKLLKAKKNIIPKYLYYYLSSENFTNDIKVKMNGEFYQRHWSYAKLVKIPIPPIEIQQQIVNEMDAKNEYIKLTERIIKEQKQKMSHIISSIWNI